ncbi:MAG: tRNA-dihydrouridine synthase [Slackia sp.]
MAGVNDIAFRQLCVECGVDLTYTEMVSSKALSFANEKTRHLLDRASNESAWPCSCSATSGYHGSRGCMGRGPDG